MQLCRLSDFDFFFLRIISVRAFGFMWTDFSYLCFFKDIWSQNGWKKLIYHTTEMFTFHLILIRFQMIPYTNERKFIWRLFVVLTNFNIKRVKGLKKCNFEDLILMVFCNRFVLLKVYGSMSTDFLYLFLFLDKII